MTRAVRRLSTPDESFSALVARAVTHLRSARGGPEMLAELRAAVDAASDHDLPRALVEGATVHAIFEPELAGAIVTVRRPALALVGPFVLPERRRTGLARALVDAATAADPVTDAWALPGDRATKSLYEQRGWKARRLTLSGEAGDDAPA